MGVTEFLIRLSLQSIIDIMDHEYKRTGTKCINKCCFQKSAIIYKNHIGRCNNYRRKSLSDT